jgi:hypothetical protein
VEKYFFLIYFHFFLQINTLKSYKKSLKMENLFFLKIAQKAKKKFLQRAGHRHPGQLHPPGVGDLQELRGPSRPCHEQGGSASARLEGSATVFFG